MSTGASHALVTGASGYIGSRLVAALAKSDIRVTATARNFEGLERFDFPPQVARVELDVSAPESCRTAFEQAAAQDGSGGISKNDMPDGKNAPADGAARHGAVGSEAVGEGSVTVAYFLVHSIGEGDFAEQDLESARQFASAAYAAGVRRIVYLGGLVPDDDELSEHLESRADVGDALGDAGVDLVWLRAAIILGAGSTSFELIRHIADRVPIIPLPTWMNHVVSPIAVDDVLRYLVAAASDDLPAGAYDISCDDRPTYSQLIKAYATSRGLRRVWLPFPPVPPRLVAIIASWLTPLPRELTADLIMSLPNSMNSHDRSIRAILHDPPGGLTDVWQALGRARIPDTVAGVCKTNDPLLLVDTDPKWAR